MSALTIQKQRAEFDALHVTIQSLDNLTDLNEVRARIEALKGWAKVHKQTKQLRLDLLRVEVEALVRIVQLGGADTLPPAEAEAAEWLAAMTPEKRAQLIAESGSATTATGMCRSVWREAEVARERQKMRAAGVELATTPAPPPVYDEGAIKAVRHRIHGVAAALDDLVETYADHGRPFTIADMAEEVMQAAGLDPFDDALDPEMAEGVREVCREAVRKSPPITIDGTVIPQFITARVGDDNTFVRVPTENALMAHLRDAIRIREEQIAHDKAALQRLADFADRLASIPGASDTSRIGDLIAATLRPERAA